MFFKNYRNEYKREQERSEKLQHQIDELKRQIKVLNQKAVDAANSELKTSKFALDFNSMRVFSIERNVKDTTLPYTIVGHWIDEPVLTTDGQVITKRHTAEWNLYCSQERHNELVDEFNKWKVAKK